MTFDTVNARAVLFGGSASGNLDNDVWQYDAATDRWAQLEASLGCPADFAPPTGRAESALEYDPINQLFWIFGGSGFGCNGPARTAGAGTTTIAIVDPTLTATTTNFYKDWTVNINDTTVYVSGYDPTSKRLFLATPLALATPGSGYFLYPQRGGGTFSYSAVTKSWSSLTGPHWGYTGAQPSNRLSPAMAYSSRDTAIVMFGGEGGNDTWTLDVETKSWVQMIPSGAPGSPPNLAQLTNSMVYDSDNDVFILFGGCLCSGDVGPSSGDTWAYGLSTNTWTKMTPAGSPPPRQGHNLVYDSTNKVAILFGGFDAPSGTYFNDLWVYRYATNTWTQVFRSMSPPGRRLGAMVYDPVRHLTVLYGGNNLGSLHDVWALHLQGPSTGNRAPALTSISPNSTAAGGPAFTLAVTGANFGTSSVIRWKGDKRPTTYVRSTQLQASIPATDVASVGTAEISVFTPAPGGGTSSLLNFTVTAPTPAPTLTSISPTTAATGSSALILTATGANFTGSSVVRVNGSNRPTTAVSATQLNATILATDVTGAGTLGISVFTPAPGGGTSASLILTIVNPTPSITGLSSSSVVVGSSGFPLTVTGTGFVSGATAIVGGQARTATVVSATQLTVAVQASDVVTQGTVLVKISNPAACVGNVCTSNSVTLSVIAPAPTTPAPTPPPTSITGQFLGATGEDKVGRVNQTTPNGTPDWHLRLQNVKSDPVTVRIDAFSGGTNTGIWVVPFNGANWIIAKTFTAGTLDLWFEPYQMPTSFNVSLTYADGTSAQASGIPSGLSAPPPPPPPVLTSISPTTAIAGSSALTLTATGANFTGNSVVRVNGSNRATTVVSATQLTAAIPASDIAVTGTLNITVLTPAPGGGTSGVGPLTVASTPPPGGASGPTFTRGQWTQWGSGSFQSAYTVSDGTLKDVFGNLIPAGTSPGNWGGTSGANGRDLFTTWSQGGVWDLSRSQWIAGPTNNGWPNLDLNVFDMPSGTWNPVGRPQRSYSEFIGANGMFTPYPASKALFGVHLNEPLAFVDVDNHYPDVAGINPTTGTRLLPNSGHNTGSLVWMPSVGRVAWAGGYGTYWSDQGGQPGVWEWDPVTKQWALDIQGNDRWPDPQYNPPGCAVWDSRRNRVLAVTGAQTDGGTLWAYDPAQAQGARITRIRTNTLGLRLTSYFACVYDPKRDQLRVYGAFPELNGQFGIFSFSGGSNSGNNPGLTGFVPTGTFAWTGAAGFVYDPVADKDVVWFGGGQFNGGNAVGKTLYVVNPDTYVSVALTPSAGADPGVPSGGDAGNYIVSVWSRFAYLPSYDAYAVIPRENTTGVFVFAPDRTSGPLSAQLPPPRLLFTDLSQGPRSGNGDTSRGQTANQNGALLTVWGQNLGTAQGASTITVGGVAPTAVYYWGDATPPACGAANLANGYQRYQCVILQIDHTTPTGAQNIVVTVNGISSNAVAVTVTTTGTVYFAGTCSSSCTGTYTNPFSSIAAGLGAIDSGDILYVKDGLNAPGGVVVPATTTCPTGCPNGPMAVVVYPGAASQVGDATHDAFGLGYSGSGNAITYAKFSVFNGTVGGTAIDPRYNSRVVGVKAQGPNGAGASGCIAPNRGNNVYILGTEFTSCGDPANFDSLYHVLYISGSRGMGAANAWGESNREVGWNYFHDNNGNRAINIYNDNQGSGSSWISGHKVHDNVIVNQVNDGILLGVGVVGENWVYNNLLVNVGLKSPSDASGEGLGMNIRARDPAGETSSLPVLLHIYNNTLLNSGVAGAAVKGAFLFTNTGTLDLHNNLIYQANGLPYISSNSTTTPGAGQATQNLWYGSGAAPAFDTAAITADPKLVSATSPYDLHLQASSPAIMSGLSMTNGWIDLYDFDGLARPASLSWDIGAYQ